LIETGKLDLVHVQADELRVKGRNMIGWMGLAMMVSTRLWLAGTVSVSRDKGLADALMHQVRQSAQPLRPLLVLTDGWAAYPNSIRRTFREKVKKLAGVGRASLEVWPQLHIGTVIKRTEKKRVVEITRQMAHGLLNQAEQLLQLSDGGSVLNTAFIERLNGTFRERLASLTRKSRHAAARIQALYTGMYLIGCTYNFCCAHQELRKATHWGRACTPAMASGLTDHVWSIGELLRYRVTPSPWVAPKRRGRPKKLAEPTALPAKRQSLQPRSRPLVRLRKGVLCSTTS
jgi:IS1 family transposase